MRASFYQGPYCCSGPWWWWWWWWWWWPLISGGSAGIPSPPPGAPTLTVRWDAPLRISLAIILNFQNLRLWTHSAQIFWHFLPFQFIHFVAKARKYNFSSVRLINHYFTVCKMTLLLLRLLLCFWHFLSSWPVEHNPGNWGHVLKPFIVNPRKTSGWLRCTRRRHVGTDISGVLCIWREDCVRMFPVECVHKFLHMNIPEFYTGCLWPSASFHILIMTDIWF